MFQGRKKAGNTQLKLQKTKEKLLVELSKTVKELQKHVLSNGCYEISKNDENALRLTFALEAIFLHGHHAAINVSGLFSKSSSSGILPSPDFWDVLRPATHRDVLHQLTHLSHVTTLVGKCRAWLRLAINDALMESYFQAILSDKKKLSQQYSAKSFLRDEEATSIVMNHFLGLIELKFDLNYNTPSLNQWTVSALQMSGAWEPTSAATATMAQRSEVPRPLSFPNVGIEVQSKPVQSPDAKKSSLTKEERNQSKNEATSLTKVEKQQPKQDIVDDKEKDKENTTANISQTVEESFGENKEATPEMDKIDNRDVPAVPMETTSSPTSPVNRPVGNMLGMGSGWSSKFEPEPANQNIVDNSQNPPTDILPPRRVTSFHGILSDYPVAVSKKFVPNEFSTQLSHDEQEVVHEDDEEYSKGLLSLSKTDFEVIGVPSSQEEGYLQKRNMMLLSCVNDIQRERGLNGQDYKCQGCSRPIGMIYGQYKVCTYDGCYYCYECHVDDEHVIPARVIHNWDLNKYKVSKHTKLFLMQIEEEPLFHIDEINPTLYNVIGRMHKTKNLRIQLQHLKGYVKTCQSTMIAEDVKRRMWPREYLWDDIHQYSLLDLAQVNSGQLQHHLKKIISFCKKHVYSCEVCSQKGFVCEICNNPKTLYAFELKYTSQCSRCHAVFHTQCKITDQCPRCLRRLSRRQRSELATPVTEESEEGLISPF